MPAHRKRTAKSHANMKGGFSIGDVLGAIGQVAKVALTIASKIITGNGRKRRVGRPRK